VLADESIKMMGQIVDHLVTGLQVDIERKRHEFETRKKCEKQLYRLLAEMVETERNYVQDLEQACDDYLPLAGKFSDRQYQSLDHRKLKKNKRNRSHLQLSNVNKTYGSLSSQESCDEIKETIKEVSQLEVRQMLGNIEDIRDYHKKVMLPKMEKAVDNANLMRLLFETEQQRLSRKYGRYCINNTRSSIIIDQNIKFFSMYQFNNGFLLRVDAMLIKPIQRLTRYHMFLSSLSKTCKELGFVEASKEYSIALESILSAASHTNTMMWIGKMENCSLDLSGQGQLLKHGQVLKRFLGGSTKLARKWSSPKSASCHLLHFQKTLVLCKENQNVSEPNNPYLVYENHISLNQVRVRDVIADDVNTFEIHKLEHLKSAADLSKSDTKSGIIMRLECESEVEKDKWVKAINSEVKQLRTTAKKISNQYLIL